jgi:hypothetical protein
VPLAMRAAAEELGDAADRMLDANGNLAGARHAWAVALAAAEAAGPPAADLCARLHARMGLAELELAPDGPTRSLTTALGGAAADGTVPLDEAVEVLARDVPAAWRQYDGLRGLAADPPDARCGRVATALAERVPLRRAYRLDRSEVPPAVVFPLVTPVEVRETGVPSLRTSPTFVPGIKSLRHRLSEQTGIRIPGVCVTASAGGAAKAPVIDILVYDHVLERVMPAVGDDRETVLLARLEDVVRANLYRLINPDDVELWLEGWDAPTPSGGNSWVPPDPPSRLRLVRVLRMLLREGVPVTDRSAVLAGFREAEDQCVPGPLEALRCVRLHLAPEVLASGAIAERRQLPPRLEAELRAGLGRDLAWSWEMDRERVAPLLDSLRAWRQDLPPGDVVVVGDPAVRRCAWRLLGVVGPAIPVLSAEELR